MTKSIGRVAARTLLAAEHAVITHPGKTIAEIAELTMVGDAHTGRALKLLEADGKIRGEPATGRKRRWYPVGVLTCGRTLVSFDKAPVTDTPVVAEETIGNAEPSVDVAALLAEIEELRAFRERALAAAPELAVHPTLRRAREIVAEVVCESERGKADVTGGGWDNTNILKAVVVGLCDTGEWAMPPEQEIEA